MEEFWEFRLVWAVILLQIVMVNPRTDLVKTHEPLSLTNESQFTKTRSSELKMLGPLCMVTRQLIWRTL